MDDANDIAARLRTRCALGEGCVCAGIARMGCAPRLRVLEAGETLVRTGAPCRAFHLLQSGAMKSAVDSSNGDTQIVSFHLPGELVGVALPDRRSAHLANVIALQRVTLCEVPAWCWDWACVRTPSMRALLTPRWNDQGHFLQSHIEMLGRANAMQKIAMFLLEFRARAARSCATDFVPLPMSRRDLGNYLGMALETASRRFGELRDQRVIELDRHGARILRPDRLAALATEPTGESMQAVA